MKKYLVLTTRPHVPYLTYSSKLELEEGDVVFAPIHSKNIPSIVIGTTDEATGYKVKEIIHKIDNVKIPRSLVNFAQKLAKYYLIDPASICKMLMPIPFKESGLSKGLKDDFSKKHETIFHYNLPPLTDEQNQAYLNIMASSKVCMLQGVTGSGKTEVYFHAIKQCLEEGKQVLLMLPEIGLTKQIIARFEHAFGGAPGVWHSSITPAKKRNVFYGVIDGSCKVVIGTRSSLFLPFKNLGMIIVDEEHDASYKQEEQSIYNGRDGAVLRASSSAGTNLAGLSDASENCKVILVSATPSMETYHNITSGKYEHVYISSRYGEAKMPEINIVDMKLEEKGEYLSKPLIKAISEALEHGKQTMLFINRKGFAPLMLCSSCGFRFTCPNCSSWLVYHKKHNHLICHHCGHDVNYSKACPECTQESLIPCGPGVERVLEEVIQKFPNAKVREFTRESHNDEEGVSVVDMIERGEIDIVIGTQILTKGYHFPNVTVVGIIDADTGLATIDLKANERCYQLLSQVSGRAGRGDYEGASYLQTYYPHNEIFGYISARSQESFYSAELDKRKESFLPPISRIIAIIISSDNEYEASELAKRFRSICPKTDRVKILGPAPASMSKLRGKYRFRLLLISDKTYNLQNYAEKTMASFKYPPHAFVRVEVDPYSFF